MLCVDRGGGGTSGISGFFFKFAIIFLRSSGSLYISDVFGDILDFGCSEFDNSNGG